MRKIKKSRRSRCLFIIVAFVSGYANTGSQEAHVHGAATLTLMQENSSVEIKLKSPAVNIVGFEHSAKSAKERELLAQAEHILNAPETLFSFTDASCKAEHIDLDTASLQKQKHDHHHRHHSEIEAHYRFTCKHGDKLKSVATHLFSYFPSVEKIDAYWVTENKQGFATLTAGNNRFLLK